MKSPVALEIEPATADRWADVVALFGRRGACGGCWCMYWRRSAAEYERGKGRGNRDALRRLVARGATPGLLAYAGGAPVGWCAVAPREAYPRLERARVLKRIDDRPVWSVVCLFVAKKCRRRGVSVALLEAAAAFAASRGARILEGYPVEPRGAMPDAFAWTGTAAAFRAAGFREAARGSPTRPIMRRALGRGD
ncbi:MAG TPA: GNAT family N-acetyltransferase [Gemmatimonadales bacterium]